MMMTMMMTVMMLMVMMMMTTSMFMHTDQNMGLVELYVSHQRFVKM